MKLDLPILYLETAKQWRAWLEEHHAQPDGVWLKFFKKGTNVPTMTYAEALDEALCYGWIDGQVKRFDEQAYLQRFTPRRAHSVWSKKNTDNANRLIEEEKMTDAGLRAIQAAKADGRWQKAYESPKNARPAEDFFEALRANPKAYDFFQTLNKQNAYAVYYRLQTAKTPESRANRIKMFVAMFEKGEKFF